MVERTSTPPKEPQVQKKAKAEKISQDKKMFDNHLQISRTKSKHFLIFVLQM